MPRQPLGLPPLPPRVVGGGQMTAQSTFEDDPFVDAALWASRMPTSTRIEDRRGQSPDYSQPVNPNGGWRASDLMPAGAVSPDGGNPTGLSLFARSPPALPPPANQAFSQPQNMPAWLPILAGVLGRGGPLAAGAYGMGKIIEPQPLNQGERVPFNAQPPPPTVGSGYPVPPPPPTVGSGYPIPAPPPTVGSGYPVPSSSPAATPPLPPPRPTPTPAPAPRPVIDPRSVDLGGYYRASVGNARTPTYVPPGQGRIAPDIFRGILAQRPS
jgi:hypothetical protein